MKKHNTVKQTFWVETNLQPLSSQIALQIKRILTKANWVLNKNNHHYLIVVGGDGTYVRFLRKYYEKKTKIVCINTGTVGFYTAFNAKNLSSFIQIITNENNYVHPQLLQININNDKCFNAMNEMVIQSLNTIRMDVKINGYLYENYMGTGFLVSTRTGATGQAKSNGGAIIFPDVNAIELVELAPTNHSKHHSFNSPTILNASAKITLDNFRSAQRCDLIIDGMKVRQIYPNDQILITKQDASFSLCFNESIKNYIMRLQKTFVKD